MRTEAERRSGVRLYVAACLVAASFVLARIVDVGGFLQPVWKAAGIAMLGLFALRSGARLAGAGLLASSVGDYVLDLEAPQWTGGMAAFGAAHLVYGLAFLNHVRARGRGPFGPFLACLSVILSLGMFIWFLPGMKSLLIPGLLYHAVITAMVALALLSKTPRAARLGAVLFLASDAVIALELYKGLGPFGPLNWLLYAPAQMLIAWGLVVARKPFNAALSPEAVAAESRHGA